MSNEIREQEIKDRFAKYSDFDCLMAYSKLFDKPKAQNFIIEELKRRGFKDKFWELCNAIK